MDAGRRPRADAPGDGLADYLSILAGTSQNLVGIVVAALATLASQVLITRALGPAGFGIVTVTTQAAFVLSFATRAGMDMAVLRRVAIDAGTDRRARIRPLVARAAATAAAVSAAVAIGAIAGAPAIRRLFSIEPQQGRLVVEAAALALPFLALTTVWLGATRGLKIMRYTLYVFWAGQPLAWIVLMLAGWSLSVAAWVTVLAYSLSWAAAAWAAFYLWRRESAGRSAGRLEAGQMGGLLRYAGPRAPAALFSQLLFWTDLFVLTRYVGETEVGVYSAALRAAQVVVLFLTSVSLMFSPFVAELHSRGETERLGRLFKTLTRWTLAATLPVVLLLSVAPGAILRVFGPEFAAGHAALLILLAGQFVNIATGSVGFVLIMVGRTGWDLAVYAGSLAVDLSLALWLCPRYGMEGAAIANAVTFGASNAVRLALVKRFVGIQPYDRHYARLLLPAAAGFAVMWLLATTLDLGAVPYVAVLAAGGLAAYALVYLATGLTPGERRAARAVLSSVRGR